MTEAVTAEYPFFEQHVSGDDGPTVGWLWHIDAERSVWCGEISRRRFDELEADHQEALGNDFGWFLVLFSKTKSAVLARVLDEYQGRDLAQTIGLGLAQNRNLFDMLMEGS